ncbi:MAG: YebC/PmpR family DNA-binding transcriptional regulator [Actinomycetota bacterium]|nr:YebC/PmpR family DNA-binding transcriptional regulator [Actinomycetota bacterium]
MSGHSKWATTKHQKAVKDARRGKMFAKLIRAIEVAARDGGGNADSNATLADAISRARDQSLPGDTIERAIKRGTGELEGVKYETLMYEGYAPGGVAVLLEVMTDNRNRAAAEVRRIFSKNGGTLAEPGAVAWMFTKKGVILVPMANASEDELLAVAMEAGAEDLKEDGDSWEVVCQPQDLHALRQAIEAAGVAIEAAQTTMEPSSSVPVDPTTAPKVLRLMDDLEDSDDVQEVYSNFDIPDALMAELAG